MKTRRLTFKFTLFFTMCMLVILVITSLLSYFNQMQLYKQQREESIQYVANYLDTLVVTDGEDFLNMQRYFIAHYEDFRLPVHFDNDDIQKSRERYEELFSLHYPKKVLGKDIQFDELSDEVKAAHAIYNYEYYRYMFEEAAKSFNIAYAYYLVPTGEPEHMYWFLDVVREEKEIDGKPYLLLCDDVFDSIIKFPLMWEAWSTGKRPKGYDTYDNEYGKTYAYYSPLFINGEKLGVIGVEVDIDKVNHGILTATIRQMLIIGGILVVIMLILLFSIYTISNMRKDLQDSEKKAQEMSELAVKDSLTGIRNKLGYDKEVQKISWEIASGLKELGVAMIDLNFLKRINDTYGHDKGNVAIISLSRIICHIFEHSPVFRIGGDEFVVILKGHDLEHIEELTETFNRQLETLQKNDALEYWEKTSAAIGYAIFDPAVDTSYDNVFKRADNKMYEAKKAMKATRE